jgi:hypothetical protein
LADEQPLAGPLRGIPEKGAGLSAKSVVTKLPAACRRVYGL